MNKKRILLLVRIMTSVTFVAMIVVNALANALPINGIGTGQVSDNYGNLFAPTGLTFSIWGLIYLLLAGYTLYQFGLFQDKTEPADDDLLIRVGFIFSLSSIYNIIWIFAWHYDEIAVSMVLMVHILACLALINRTLQGKTLDRKAKFLLRLPFRVYFGWITVATIANAATLLVSKNWNGFGIQEQIWTIAVLLTGVLIGSAVIIRFRDMAYGLVLVWVYVGILIKHLSGAGFAGRFPEVYSVVIVCLVLLLIAIGRVAIAGKSGQKKEKSSPVV